MHVRWSFWICLEWNRSRSKRIECFIHDGSNAFWQIVMPKFWVSTEASMIIEPSSLESLIVHHVNELRHWITLGYTSSTKHLMFTQTQSNINQARMEGKAALNHQHVERFSFNKQTKFTKHILTSKILKSVFMLMLFSSVHSFIHSWLFSAP